MTERSPDPWAFALRWMATTAYGIHDDARAVYAEIIELEDAA